MPRAAVRNQQAVSAPPKKRKAGRTRKLPPDVQRTLDEYHALVERIARLNLKPFSAAKEQQEIRRKELGR